MGNWNCFTLYFHNHFIRKLTPTTLRFQKLQITNSKISNVGNLAVTSIKICQNITLKLSSFVINTNYQIYFIFENKMHPVYAFKIGFCFFAISIFIHHTRRPAGLMRINIMFHDIHEYCNDYTFRFLSKQFFSHKIFLYSTFAPYVSPMNV